MKIGESDGVQIYHDIHDSFGQILRETLSGNKVGVALGPLYSKDPAEELLLPFKRSIRESKWNILNEEQLAPDSILEKAKELRSVAIELRSKISNDDLNDWTRAGLVLEIARGRGIHICGTKEIAHVPWKLNGTVTGRFGTEPVKIGGSSFNPHSLSEDDRIRIKSSDCLRQVAVIDFRAMDLCSMVSLIPGLAEKYAGYEYDLHFRTAQILFPHETITPTIRNIIKNVLFVYAYGGLIEPALFEIFGQKLPELSNWFKSMPHGEGARLIQSQSSLAFRAALSNALAWFLGDNIIPMFTVHDEIVLDVSDVGFERLKDISKDLEQGASQRIGIPYKTRTSVGYTYQEAKKS
jgi:hypothetical protein